MFSFLLGGKLIVLASVLLSGWIRELVGSERK